MFTLRDKGFLFFVATPYVRCWADLEARGMKMADLPMWDATRDFLLTDVAYRVGTGKYYGHFLMESGVLAHDGHYGTSGTVSDGDEKGMLEAEGKGSFPARSRWNMLQRELDNERVKNDCLYHAFLPRPVAHMVRSGIIPPGEMFADVSALFCDIVHFIQLVANCQPRDVVGVLNSLTTRFDRVTKVHDTFRVESIGDACVIISGAPEKVPNHAERIANTALGMMCLSQEVASPLYGEKIQIRIGVHTGSMLCGVVGTKLPRFIVLGETAVVASKMESHGVPGKIHISPSTYSAIKSRGFTIEERGKTELRGYGALNTYFLVANEHATDDDLCGRPRIGTQEISFINEGKEEKPSFDKKNKKAVQTPSSGSKNPRKI
ncbi:hypothetical protein FSP39_020028 [Pinctada imbricata]|uniref:guanylate cyclase n=1 Tax=Pinctada imbricata TaxID=66713 RepID=A0AA89C5T8_PINIB|nr:hypothetical protein FSP39_020028 [Pinctada imbricata]